jgi:tetratricopeptide (TPR) repeat protein
MQAEREHLIKHVFPDVRARCRERGITFTEIDLRWGITEEESRRGDVVNVCLDEIDRCRPFFIAILGNRYGWVPDLSDPETARELKERMPWAAEAIDRGCSLVELEIRYGALGVPRPANHAFFYFTQPARGQLADEEKPSAQLAALKDEIRASRLPLREDIPDRDSLGRAIADDLLRSLDELRPAAVHRSNVEADRARHEGFAATRRHAYFANARNVRRLDEHVEGEGQPLVVLGDSGAGKTSLMAHWSQRYRSNNPNAFCVTHYIGATETAGDIEIVTRVMAEIKERYAIEDELPQQLDEVVSEFPQWLARVQGETLVLVIDALDQLEGDARELRWLPTYVPPNVRLIVSTLKGPVLETLREREWEELTVQPLDADAREAVIEAYLGPYRKVLTPKQLRRIAEDNQCSNPLFLRTLLEELRIFGRFEQLDARINHLLSAIDLDDLFQRVLERIEADYGAELTQAALLAIWASRRGLSESELLEVTGTSRLRLSPLLQALEHHLMRRAGMLDFFHRFVRQAVERRYARADVAISSEITRMHKRLAAYFSAQEPSARRLDELPWQLHRAGAWESLRDCLADLETFSALADQARYELLQYWVSLGEHYDIVSVYEQSAASLDETAEDDTSRAQLFERIGAFLGLASRYDGAERFLKRALDIRESVLGRDHVVTARTLSELGDVLDHKGNLAEASRLHRRALSALEAALGAEHLETARAMEMLGLSLMRNAEYAEAERCFRQALDVRERHLSPTHLDAIRSLELIARALDRQGKYDEAVPLHRRVLALRERLLGREHPLVLVSLNNLGIVLTNLGELTEAETVLRRALGAVRRAFGPRSSATASVLNNLSDVQHDKAEFELAEESARAALAIREDILGEKHPLTALALVSLVAALIGQSRYEDAEPFARRSVAVWEKLDPGHSDHTDGLRVLGEILVKTGRFEEAEPLLRRALEIAEKTVGPDHRDARIARQVLAAFEKERTPQDGGLNSAAT